MVRPKLPEDPQVVQLCRDATALSQTDFKQAQLQLKAAVAAGQLPAAVQRQLVDWWARDGVWADAPAAQPADPGADKAALLMKKWANCTYDEKCLKMMRDKQW